MIRDFSLCKCDKLYNWYGEVVSREDSVLRLKVGDFVRVSIKRNPYKMRKGKYKNMHIDQRDFYFEITKIDRYKYGGIHKPRKFHGVARDIYNQFEGVDYIKCGQEISFRSENIYEIPGWNNTNHLEQKNKKKLDKYDYDDCYDYEDYKFYKKYPEDKPKTRWYFTT